MITFLITGIFIIITFLLQSIIVGFTDFMESNRAYLRERYKKLSPFLTIRQIFISLLIIDISNFINNTIMDGIYLDHPLATQIILYLILTVLFITTIPIFLYFHLELWMCTIPWNCINMFYPIYLFYEWFISIYVVSPDTVKLGINEVSMKVFLSISAFWGIMIRFLLIIFGCCSLITFRRKLGFDVISKIINFIMNKIKK
jgi:hypothetical protein